MDSSPKYLIVGPGRSGKTTFTNYLFENPKSIIGFPVEGLFLHFWNRPYYYSRYNIKAFILEYLTKQRGMAENKQITARPIDYYKSSLDELLLTQATSFNKISLINSLLDAFIADYNVSSCAITDCNSEYYYEQYKNFIPNLKLIFVFRDPRETVCSNIYWRRDIDPKAIDSKLLQHYTLTWAISVQHYLKLKKLYPNDVNCVYLSRKIDEIYSHHLDIFNLLDIDFHHFIKSTVISNMHYSYKDGLFLNKSNQYEKLLPFEFIEFIEYFCSNLMQEAFGLHFNKSSSSTLFSQSELKYCFDILSTALHNPLTSLQQIGFSSIRDRDLSIKKYHKKALEFASRNKHILNYLLFDRSKSKF